MFAVISPFNFPMALSGGPSGGALVAGNAVVYKPSSDSPTIAAKFIEVLEEVGLPEGVVNFCPGAGASFGDAIVAHPKTRFIAFTGSREVGLHIADSVLREATERHLNFARNRVRRLPCRGGETGRRTSLRGWRPQGRRGSNPLFRTNL